MTWGDLGEAVRGTVVAAGDDGFDDLVRGHNTALRHEPDVVVRAADAADVAATVRYAARRRLRVQVQSTGHGPPALARGGVLLLTRALDDIDVDLAARTVHVGAGATWGELVAACGEHGLAPLGLASVASVGVAGYLLGGGMGPLGRRDGFGADHVLAVEVVDARGQARTVDAENEPDLFWALRGGRMAPVIVTAFTLRLGRAPELFTASATYEVPDAPDALAAFAAWQPSLAETMSSAASLLRFPDLPVLPEQLRGRRFLQIDFLAADDIEAGRAAVERLTDRRPPATRSADVTDPAGWMKALPPVPPGPSWQRGLLLDRLDEDVAAALIRTAGLESGAPWNIVELRPFGGALGRPPASDNAVGGRSDSVLVNLVAGTPAGSAGLPEAAAELAAALGDRVKPGLSVNFHGTDGPQNPLRNAWPAGTVDRLRAVADRYDPDGVFPRPTTGW